MMHAWLSHFYIVVSTVIDACDTYWPLPLQNFTDYTCTIRDTSGGTPLGFKCIEMTYPELTMNIDDYPCYTVNNVAGRHIEVLVSKLDMDPMLI